MKYRVVRYSKRGKMMESSLPSVLDPEVPFEAIQSLREILEDSHLMSETVRLETAAEFICKKGDRFVLGMQFHSCAPAKVQERGAFKGMLWFFFSKSRHEVVQFVGTLSDCRYRIKTGR